MRNEHESKKEMVERLTREFRELLEKKLLINAMVLLLDSVIHYIQIH